MPFGPYKDMEDCMSKNKDKDSPGGYCATIHKKITGNWPSEKEYKVTRKERIEFLTESLKNKEDNEK